MSRRRRKANPSHEPGGVFIRVRFHRALAAPGCFTTLDIGRTAPLRVQQFQTEWIELAEIRKIRCRQFSGAARTHAAPLGHGGSKLEPWPG